MGETITEFIAGLREFSDLFAIIMVFGFAFELGDYVIRILRKGARM